MGAFKKVVGLDVVDFGIQFVTTGFLAGLADVISTSNDDAVVLLICAASTMLFGVRRHFALKRHAREAEATGEVAGQRVDELELRVADLEQGQVRMQELEERLDFAERMLTQQLQARQLASREEP